jgi:hypothetical protein
MGGRCGFLGGKGCRSREDHEFVDGSRSPSRVTITTVDAILGGDELEGSRTVHTRRV